MTEKAIKEVIENLTQLQEDNTIPKNVRSKINDAILALKEDKAIPVKVNKTLQELEEISENPNVPQYTRTQLWNIVSSLETI